MAMKLSAELFDEIITSLRSDGTSSHGHEKRTEGRVGLRCAMEIVPCTFNAKNSKPISIFVHDLSLKGIGLVSPVKLEENMEFVARLTREGHPLVPVLYKVRYCRKLSGELHSVGAIFQRVLPDSSGEVMPLGRNARSVKKKIAPKIEESTEVV